MAVLELATRSPAMHSTRWIRASALALLALSAAAGTLAAGKVDLKWVEPEKFSDVGFGTAERQTTLQALAEHIERLGHRLPDGQTLKIEVTDVDLAGDTRFHSGRDVRVLRGRADWPSMQLRYALQADGRELKSGQARLADMNYLFNTRHDAFGYEKRMIDNWFRAEIAPQP
jgi:Protein of unknown function (DUF3016)